MEGLRGEEAQKKHGRTRVSMSQISSWQIRTSDVEG